jgi:hypothetical protein
MMKPVHDAVDYYLRLLRLGDFDSAFISAIQFFVNNTGIPKGMQFHPGIALPRPLRKMKVRTYGPLRTSLHCPFLMG